MNEQNRVFVPRDDRLPQRMVQADADLQRGMVDFVQWCLDNEPLLRAGRKIGFRLGVTPAVKDLILLSSTSDPEKARRILSNLQDVAE